VLSDLTQLSLDQKIALIGRGLAKRPAGAQLKNSGRTFAQRFVGRPSAFITELMPAFAGPDWAAWRSFIKTVFAETQDDEEQVIFRQCTGLATPPDQVQREAWLPVGRRGGKSRIEAFIACYLAACFDWTPWLAPGEVGSIVVLADTREHAAAIMNYVKATLTDHPQLRKLVRRLLVETVELEGRVEIEVVTASIKAVRSRTVVAALLDEIAFWQPDETCANPDTEIINSLRPAMLTIPNSMQIAASSRYARKGVLWNAYRDFYGKPEGPLVWSASTETMHPSVDREFLAQERERDPIAFEAEYGEEFRSDVAAFVPREVVEAAVTRGVGERPFRVGTTYQAFVDPSGGSGTDSMTMAIAHLEGDRGVVDLIREVRPPFSPDSVTAEFAETLKSYRVARVKGDHYAGEWCRKEFRKNGIEYEVSDDAKSAIYLNWLPILNSRRCDLLDNPRLIAQASTLERRTSRVGKDTIDHAPAGHDDVVNVVAGAIVMVAGAAGPVVIPAEAMAMARMRMISGMRR